MAGRVLSPQTRSQSLEKIGKKTRHPVKVKRKEMRSTAWTSLYFPKKDQQHPTHGKNTKGDQSLCLFDKSGRHTSFHTQIILFSPQTPKSKVRVTHKTNKIPANSSPTSRQLWRGPSVDALIPAWRIRSSENRMRQSPNGADGDFHISKLQEEKKIRWVGGLFIYRRIRSQLMIDVFM